MLVLIFQIFRKIQRDYSIKIDDRTISAGDFTVLLTGFQLPQGENIDAQRVIHEWA